MRFYWIYPELGAGGVLNLLICAIHSRCVRHCGEYVELGELHALRESSCARGAQNERHIVLRVGGLGRNKRSPWHGGIAEELVAGHVSLVLVAARLALATKHDHLLDERVRSAHGHRLLRDVGRGEEHLGPRQSHRVVQFTCPGEESTGEQEIASNGCAHLILSLSNPNDRHIINRVGGVINLYIYIYIILSPPALLIIRYLNELATII